MRRILVALSCVILSYSAFANRECRSPDRNSCWEAVNESPLRMKVHCRLPYGKRFFVFVNGVGSTTRQFNSGWGDGLGFPEPAFVYCDVTRDGKTLSQSFKTINWGDRVQIKLLKDLRVKITDRESWGTRERVYFAK